MNIESYLTNPEIFQYGLIKTDEIPFSDEIIEMCRENRCGKYASCWTCPPGAGTQRELEKRIKKYKNALVFSCKYDLEDSFDVEGMFEAGKKTKRVLESLIEELSKNDEKFMSLGCGACTLCEECTYPYAPCRFPNRAVPSVEACGINVSELSKKAGINYINGTNTITYFCMILF